MKSKKGFVGLIAILIVLAIAVIWMVYLLRHNWYSAPDLHIPVSGSETQGVENKSVPAQLDALKQDMKRIQDEKDKEIRAEMGK